MKYKILFSALLFLMLITDGYSRVIDITADEFLYEREKDYMVAKGNVEADLDGLKIYADTVYFDKKNQMIYVDGRIKILRDFLGIGEGLKYDLKNKEGYLKNVELYYFSEDKKKQKFIWGDEIIILDNDSFYIKNGYFSSCDGIDKPWYIKGCDIKINLGQYLTARDVKLYASDIPMFYSPYFIAPVKKEKESGFLMPVFGFSGKHGFVLNQPYYFFLDESYDNTLSLNLRTEDTIGFDNEFRYMLSKKEEGFLNLSFYENYKIDREYLHLNFKHNKENRLKINTNLLNRRDFFYEYKNDREEKSQPYLRNMAFLEKPIKRDIYSLAFFNGYNLNLNDRDFSSLSINKDSYPLGINNYFFYNLDGSLNLVSQGSNNYERLILKPYGVLRSTRKDHDLSMKISGYFNYYTDQLRKEEKKGYVIFNPELKVYKNFLVNERYANKNSLSLSPVFPVKAFDNLSRTFDKKDVLNSDRRIEYNLEQKHYDLYDGRLLYNLNINQSYILNNSNGESSFSDLGALFRAYGESWIFGLTGTISHINRDIKDFMSYLNVKHAEFDLNVNYTKTILKDEFLNLDVIKRINNSLAFSAGIKYDIESDVLKETAFGVEYLKNCYSIKVDLRNRKEPSEFNLFLFINLYGLGEIRQAL